LWRLKPNTAVSQDPNIDKPWTWIWHFSGNAGFSNQMITQRISWVCMKVLKPHPHHEKLSGTVSVKHFVCLETAKACYIWVKFKILRSKILSESSMWVIMTWKFTSLNFVSAKWTTWRWWKDEFLQSEFLMNVSAEQDHATEYTAAVFYSFNLLRSYAKYIQFFVRVQLNWSFNTQLCSILSLCIDCVVESSEECSGWSCWHGSELAFERT
jgi:hypothetical protein